MSAILESIERASPAPGGGEKGGGFERVFGHLRERILAGVIQPGDRLAPERELALQLGVSRPVLREALRALSMVGVVEIRHGAGTVVRRPDVSVLGDFLAFAIVQRPEMGDDIMDARVAIECQAIRLACRRAEVGDLERLRAALDRVQATADVAALDVAALGASADAGAVCDYAFHAALVRASKSPTLICLYDAMADLLIRSLRRRRDLGRDFDALRPVVARGHRHLFEAVVAGDEGRAELALREHFAIGDEYRRRAATRGSAGG